MAQKRMMSRSVIETDKFMDMPATTQCLYFHLMMNADDDGFLASPKRVMRAVGSSADDMTMLISKGYVIPFESGVIVITHWRVHNQIQKDRYKRSECDEFELVQLTARKTYEVKEMDTNCIQNGNRVVTDLDTNCIQIRNRTATQNVSILYPQNRIDKNRLDKSNTTTTTKDISSCSQEDWEAVRAVYEDNINPVSGQIEMQKLTDDISHYGREAVIKAIEVAVSSNKRRLNYIEGILKNWETGGYGQGATGNRRQGNEADKRKEIDWDNTPNGWGPIEEK